MPDGLSGLVTRARVTPPIPDCVVTGRIQDSETANPPPLGSKPELISGFTCFIDYEGTTRRIVCRRFDVVGDTGYVGAICLSANGYRQFRIDRIQTVSDALTGEVIGDGTYFIKFAADLRSERPNSWGLKPSQKATLISGLNVLAFMARCDGHWHPLESEPIEKFVCSMWLRKEWPNDPPLGDIIAHAQRLSPDSETFFRGLAHYSQSATSTLILRRAVGDLIEADGLIAESEFKWGLDLDSFFRDHDEHGFELLSRMAHDTIA